MSHYKKYSEHRHARDVAKQRLKGYEEGGNVRRFPVSGTQYDLNRLRSAQGVESGRIGGIPGARGNVVYGPGLNARGEMKRNVLRRMKFEEDAIYAKGGRVKPDTVQDKTLIKKAMKAHDQQLHGGKHTKLVLKDGGRIPLTGGAESGVGRMELAGRAAKRRK